ncbi:MULTISPECIES: sulfate reduction electron transfer complex DsrMKJOP subunit DsrK [Thiorhodovibrio]|uniref:sulfate reduction electron transfer complex DsrMKJOP subunit DsrK n=1 Tax=Thiorhodovibrio TaxID=61593 RepID=UPI0019119E2D|nr:MULTISPECIES: (Fe-S)-binding protein [Thiorhodovibrio]MBK5970672.1 reductase [Thiorhodovibrio winogradskyi]WPL14216.1 Intracellular sulfur oxidation protein DsrM [Thiorhodovibrio litoralis]
MAKANFEVPALKEYAEIPEINPGVMAHSKPYKSKPEFQEALGFPGELVEDWQKQAINKMGDLLGRYRSLRVYLDSCVKCGACTDKCHYYLGTHDPKNMPVGRQDLLRKVYRRYFTLAGRLFPDLVGATDLTEEVLGDWYNYFHQCSQCRRCSVFCPYGIDTAEISMAAREIMDHIGIGQKYCNEIIGKVYKIGNNLGLPGPALADTLEGLEEDVFDETGVEVKYPVDQEGADILLVTPSADFFAEPHVDGLIGYGKVFHEAGVSWTLSSYASEAANFGMFIGSYDNMRRVALRIREAAIKLGVKRIVFGECGHAWRVAYSFLNTLAGPWDFLDPRYPVPQHICEFTYDLIQQGKLKIDKSQNDDMVLTYHDSCNVARASRMGDKPGGQFDIPRAIIRRVCNNFYDMDEETIRDRTFCCGGGGGLLTDDLMEVRVKGAQPRVEALNHVIQEKGVTHMAAICAICKSQFTKVLPYYGMDMDQIVSVHQLVSNALVLTGQESDDSDDAPSGEPENAAA